MKAMRDNMMVEEDEAKNAGWKAFHYYPLTVRPLVSFVILQYRHKEAFTTESPEIYVCVNEKNMIAKQSNMIAKQSCLLLWLDSDRNRLQQIYKHASAFTAKNQYWACGSDFCKSQRCSAFIQQFKESILTSSLTLIRHHSVSLPRMANERKTRQLDTVLQGRNQREVSLRRLTQARRRFYSCSLRSNNYLKIPISIVCYRADKHQ